MYPNPIDVVPPTHITAYIDPLGVCLIGFNISGKPPLLVVVISSHYSFIPLWCFSLSVTGDHSQTVLLSSDSLLLDLSYMDFLFLFTQLYDSVHYNISNSITF